MSYIPSSDSQYILDASGTTINPTTEETVFLLRRMVKLLESNATVDALNRLRINVDTFNPGIAIGVTQITPTLLQMTANQATATSLQMTANQATASSLQMTANQATASNLNANVGLIGGIDPRFQFIDNARIAFATSIRNNLTY